MNDYIQPEKGKNGFHCPNCGVYSDQYWFPLRNGYSPSEPIHGFEISQCSHCDKIAIWNSNKMVFPLNGTAPRPNPDMPENVKKIFEEARLISDLSPRAAAGLLRLCVEKLTVELGENEGKLNTRIANLVKSGIPDEMQKAFDIVRITGNDELHVGQIGLDDDSKIVTMLFKIVNIIVQRMISEKNQINEMYESLPKDKLEGIDNRDNKKE